MEEVEVTVVAALWLFDLEKGRRKKEKKVNLGFYFIVVKAVWWQNG